MGRLRWEILVVALVAIGAWWAGLSPLAGAAPEASAAITAITAITATGIAETTGRAGRAGTAAAAATSGADIRDLRGPLPDGGAPPFALTYSELLAAGVLVFAWARPRRRRTLRATVAPEACGNPADVLAGYAASYHQGEFTALLLCLRIAALLRSALAGRAELPATGLTSGELLERLTLRNFLASGELARAGRLLNFCDRVKFAGYDPDAAEAEWLLAEAGALLSPPKGAA